MLSFGFSKQFVTVFWDAKKFLPLLKFFTRVSTTGSNEPVSTLHSIAYSLPRSAVWHIIILAHTELKSNSDSKSWSLKTVVAVSASYYCFYVCWHQEQLFSFSVLIIPFSISLLNGNAQTSTEELNLSKLILKYQTLCSLKNGSIPCILCLMLRALGTLSTLEKSITLTKEK